MAGDGIQNVDLKVFIDLMRISTLRGTDGTGIFQGRFKNYGDDSHLLVKRPWEVNNFVHWMRSKNGNKLLVNSTIDNVFIGHTRWATTGGMNESDCHPYHIKNIVGAHNGTMEDFKYWSKSETDSLLLYKDIQARGAKTVLEEADGDSAFALTWVDMNEKKLYFARNIERPLFGMVHKDREVLYWASEEGFLLAAAKRHDLTVGDIFYFESGKIYSIGLQDIKKDSEFKFEEEKIKLKLKPKPVIHKTSATAYMDNYSDIAWGPSLLNDDLPFGNDPVVSPTKLTKAQRKEIKRMAKEKRLNDMRKIHKAHSPSNSNSNISLAVVNLISTSSKTALANLEASKIPIQVCMTCDKELHLIDQYYSDKVKTKEGDILFECDECCAKAEQLAKMDNQEAVTIN